MFYWMLLLLGAVICSPTKRPLYGIITSPNYPNPYPNSNDSIWDIVVPEGHRISLSFLLFDLEPSEYCNYDFMKIMADKKELGRFCGSLGSSFHPGRRRFVSQGNQMTIQFHSDFSNEDGDSTVPYQGFQAYYQAQDSDECSAPDGLSVPWTPPCQHICHNYVGGYFCSCLAGYKLQNDKRSCKVECSSQLYTEESGTISSPEYPKPYPPDLNCNYSIRVEKGLIISIRFQGLFEIDDHPQARCPYDTLKIFAGERLLDTVCGKWPPDFLKTQSNSVDIVFQTDESGDSRGWKLHYTTEAIRCPHLKPLDQFSIISPQQAEYKMQEYVVVTCKTGYKLMEGSTELRSFTSLCQSDGTWHRPLPRCEIVSCKEPQPLTNGKITFETAPGILTYQSVITYSCNTPYYRMVTPTGSERFTCSDQRIWKDENGGDDIPHCLPVCGKPENPVIHTSRIIGGKKAAAGNFPWQVLVNHGGRGGGVLIGEHWVLTAAHVIRKQNDNQENMDDPSNVDIFMGDVDVHELIKLSNNPVEKILVHPGYNNVNFDNDIALLRLKNPVVMDQNLSPICLPESDNKNLYNDGRLGFVSGFGVTENDTIANHLRYVSLPMVRRPKCQEYVDTKKSPNTLFTENMFCAGFPESKGKKGDSCAGDSGGPYASKEPDDTWFVTGLVSWGIDCGKGYGFYTKVSNYLGWIHGYINM
ncbi:complement C1r subcomponent [Discoglossus pictus]